MTYILRTHQLTKTFHGKEVVSSVSMSIKKGEVYGLLGPNGSGKTTIMKMLTNLIKPTSGEVEILGKKMTTSSYEMFKRIGSIIEYPVFYEELTAGQNLELHCEYMGYHHKRAIIEALEMVNLTNIEDKLVKEFSLGMKQKLGIARAIVTKPELLILDEPINGLDPISIHELRDLFKILSKEYSTTLLISSHILGEIEQIADTVGIIREGKLIKEVSMDSIREEYTTYLELSTPNTTQASYILEHKLNIRNFRITEENKVIKIFEMNIPQDEIIQTMIENNISIHSFNRKTLSLEDYFLQFIHGGVQNASPH